MEKYVRNWSLFQLSPENHFFTNIQYYSLSINVWEYTYLLRSFFHKNGIKKKVMREGYKHIGIFDDLYNIIMVE